MFPEDRMMEILMIGALALIVIGPKDLPVAMRKLGRFAGKLRGMAAEFRASFDELARQSELDELRKEVEALRSGRDSIVQAVNPMADSHVAATAADLNQQLRAPISGPTMTSQIAAERAAVEAGDAALPVEPPAEAKATGAAS